MEPLDKIDDIRLSREQMRVLRFTFEGRYYSFTEHQVCRWVHTRVCLNKFWAVIKIYEPIRNFLKILKISNSTKFYLTDNSDR